MSVKVNEKGSWPKMCTDCEVELNPGVNCYLSAFNVASYKCKSCKKKQSKVEHIHYWSIPAYVDKKNVYLREYHDKDGAGVYAIYENDMIIYIGESAKIRSRITAHFSKHIQTEANLAKGFWQSPIPLLLAKGKIDRDDLSYEILATEDDKVTRQSREKQCIQDHITKYGAKPAYNTYST